MTTLKSFLYLVSCKQRPNLKIVKEARNRFQDSIPPAYVAWRAGTMTLFVVPARQWIASLESIPVLLNTFEAFKL